MALVGATASALGTILVLGGGTLVVTKVLTSAVTAVIKVQQRKTAISCSRCEGRKTRRCSTCKGAAVLDWQPFVDPQVHRWALCPLCSGDGRQKCFNCLGTGTVQPPG